MHDFIAALKTQTQSFCNDRRGFTLVESTVSIVVLALVLVIIAGVITFASNMMFHQQAVSNAQTLASTIRSSLEATLSSQSEFKRGDDGESFQFVNNKGTNYLGKGSYEVSVHHGDQTPADSTDQYVAEGQIAIKESGTTQDYPLLPAATYIDNDTVNMTVDGDDNDDPDYTITVNVTNDGNSLASSTINIPKDNAPDEDSQSDNSESSNDANGYTGNSDTSDSTVSASKNSANADNNPATGDAPVSGGAA